MFALIMAAQLAEKDQITPRLLRDDHDPAAGRFRDVGNDDDVGDLQPRPDAWSQNGLRSRSCPGADETPGFADLAALLFTRAVIEETLRLRPAVWALRE